MYDGWHLGTQEHVGQDRCRAVWRDISCICMVRHVGQDACEGSGLPERREAWAHVKNTLSV